MNESPKGYVLQKGVTLTGGMIQPDILTEDSYIDDAGEWVDRVYLIDEQDYVHGGEHGYANVPHEQLANRTLYLKNYVEAVKAQLDSLGSSVDVYVADFTATLASLRVDLNALNAEVTQLRADSDAADANLQAQIDVLGKDLADLNDRFLKHVHNYAGSNVPGGDALTVDVGTATSTAEVNLVGTTGFAVNRLLFTGVLAKNGEVTARRFKGDLDGTATAAGHLSTPFTLTLSGDVTGFTSLDGSANVNLSTTLASTGVKDGYYGPVADVELDNVSAFVVPYFQVNRAGLVLSAVNRVISLPNMMRSRTSGATNATGKLFLIGAEQQTDVEKTYSEAGAYVIDGQLYSNKRPVITTTERQSLTNKTYEGYTLGDACERAVDNTIGGTLNSGALITSNAVFRHTHPYKYALSDVQGGDALGVKLGTPVSTGYVVVNDGTNSRLALNKTISIDSGKITADEITVTKASVSSELNVPGGRLWIETVVLGESDEGDPSLYDDTELKQRIGALEIASANQAITVGDLGGRLNDAADEWRTASDDLDARVSALEVDVSDFKEVLLNSDLFSPIYTRLSRYATHEEVEERIADDLGVAFTVTFDPDVPEWVRTVDNPFASVVDGSRQTFTRTVTLAKGTPSCARGRLLSYGPGGYVLADCSSPSTTVNLVFTLEQSTRLRVPVAQSATVVPLAFLGQTALVDGDVCVVGHRGEVTVESALDPGDAVRVVGYVEGDSFVFRP